MVGICQNCGLCCLETEMILSNNDIDLILESDNQLSKEDFILNTGEGLNKLKNVNGHCYFYDFKGGFCKIYLHRPKGCIFYPLIYDLDEQQCTFDDTCPHRRHFYKTNKSIRITCKKIKLFLLEELGFKDLR